jgi:hypothetical protein
MKTFSCLWQYTRIAELFLEWEMFQINAIGILCSADFFRKSCHLWDNVENYGGTSEAVDYKMAALCMLDN